MKIAASVTAFIAAGVIVVGSLLTPALASASAVPSGTLSCWSRAPGAVIPLPAG